MRAWLAALLLPAVASSAPCVTRSDWPTTAWNVDTATTAANRPTQLAALEQYAFTLTGADSERKGIRTDALLLIHGGKIIYERYARGWSATNRHYMWSVSKSVTSALTGIAVAHGALSIEDSICQHLPSTPSQYCPVVVRNLLEFTSGIDWAEDYENAAAGYQASSVLAMLYGVGHKDMAGFVTSQPKAAAAGTKFVYSTGESTLLSSVVGEAMEPSYGASWPWDLFFTPLGIDAVFERDPKNHLVGGAYFYATARDVAKLGFLYLNDGCWETGRMLPDGWVASSVAPTAESGGQQGRQFWLNRTNPPVWPDAPLDTYTAIGHWGQYVTVFPSLDLVMVRLGDDRDGTLDLNELMKRAAAVVQ